MPELREIIDAQRKGKENTPEWMIGEQLLEIAAESELNAELIAHDLETSEMKLSDAAAAFRKYASEHRGGKSEFCIIPSVADGILRKFHGIGEKKEGQPLTAQGGAPLAQGSQEGGFVDLTEFL